MRQAFWISYFLCLASALAQDDTLEPFIVESTKLADWPSSIGYRGETVTREALLNSPGTTVSDRLLGRGGFRLFRRQSSLTAHPTTQGAALRVAGPNAAGRTNVYLDGVPLYDAFGGWIPWSSLNPLSLNQASVIQPSGIDPWGNVSLGGSVWLETRQAQPFWSFEGSWGDALDHQLANAFLFETPNGATRLYGNWSSLQSAGYHLLKSNQRGPIDRKGTLETQSLMLGFLHEFDSAWSVEETSVTMKRIGNGTPLAVNAQDAWQARLALHKERAGDIWEGQLTAYWNTRDFTSTFTSVNAGRDGERPVLDQFDVPSWAAGLTWRSRHWVGDDHEIAFGLDGRILEGETNERFRNLGDGFTRLRQAGGERLEAGVTLEHIWQATPTLSLKSSVRVDHHRDRSGAEKTWDLTSGDRLTDQSLAQGDEWQLNGRLGLQWDPNPEWKVHWAGFSGTRRPTLNELYRPFRVGNDITLANPELDSERLWGTALALGWQPEARFTFHLEGFWHRLDDGVANVTLAQGGGVVNPWGFIPEGGSGRQRRNLEEVTIMGFETALTWQIHDHWQLEAGYLLTDSEVQKSDDQSALEGNTLAQSPTHQAHAALRYDAQERAFASLEGRWTGSVFEDDLNLRTLDEALVVNLHLGWRWTDEVSCFIAVENLLDEEVEVGRTGSGLIGLGAPRLMRLGLRLDF